MGADKSSAEQAEAQKAEAPQKTGSEEAAKAPEGEKAAKGAKQGAAAKKAKPEGEKPDEAEAETKPEEAAEGKPKEAEEKAEKAAPETKPEEEAAEPDKKIDEMSPAEVNDYKEGLFEKRTELLEQKKRMTAQMTEIRGKINQLRKERDEFNLLVKDSKRERATADGEIKSIAALASVEGEKLPRFGKAKYLEEDLKKLEWKYETSALKPSEDRKLSTQIEDLRKALQMTKEAEKKDAERLSKLRKFDDIKKEQRIFHMNVLKYAEDSEKRHQQLVVLYKQIDKVKDERGALDKRIDALTGKIAASKAILSEEREKDKKEKEKKRDSRQREEKKLIKDKYEGVQKKLKEGGKLTREDLMIIQEHEGR